MTFDEWNAEPYSRTFEDAWKAGAASRDAVVESLRQQLAAKQAEVDALMLEYCPNEMSQEQLDNWAAHQRPAKEQ